MPGNATRNRPSYRQSPYPPQQPYRQPQTPPSRPVRRPPARRSADWYVMRRRRRRRVWLRRGLFLAAILIVVGTAAVVVPFLAPPVAAGSSEDPAAGSDAAAAAAASVDDDRYLVAIDPGHGGVDPGAEGLGFDEYEMTWQTACDLLELFQADGRFNAFTTISEEESQNPDAARITPRERALRANDRGADLLLSIHGNSDTIYNASGYECYAQPTRLSYNAESLRFANLLATRFSEAGMRLRGTNGVRYTYYDANDDKYLIESDNTQIYSDPTFGVLEYANCPAVLSEQCFVTNSSDVAAFAGDSGCRAAAELYYAAICSWFGVDPA